MKLAIVNTNLASGGKLAYLADTVAQLFRAAGHEVQALALSELSLPACDGFQCYEHEMTQALTRQLDEVEAIVLVSPIYNYDLNAAAKNLIELTGSAWQGKAVGLVCLAGGGKSYLASLGFLNSLSIDHRCLVSPRYVYVQRDDFSEEGVLPENSNIFVRLRFLISELPILARAAAEIRNLRRLD